MDIERAKDVREWFETLDKDTVEIHPLSVGSGLENLLKEARKDETLKRFCTSKPLPHYINPEEATNTVEQDEHYHPNDDNDECDND